ncbi:hypothetical protein M153_3307000194, partial [Pseudoloma neurophilia]
MEFNMNIIIRKIDGQTLEMFFSLRGVACRHHIDFCDTFRQILYQISYCFIFKTSLKQSFSTSIK